MYHLLLAAHNIIF